MPFRWPYWARLLGLAAVYFITARLGLLAAFPRGDVTAVWPPSGIALAAVLLASYRVWPGIALGALLTSFSTGAPVPGALAMAAGQTLEIIGAAWLLQRFQVDHHLARVKDVFHFLLAVLLACGIAATVGAAGLWLSGAPALDQLGWNWLVGWLGDSTSIVILTPLLLSWNRLPPLSLFLRRWAELAFFILALFAATQLILEGGLPVQAVNEMPYAFLIFLLWAAFRFGQRLVTLSIVLISAAVVWATVHDTGPFADPSLAYAMLSLQVFLGVFPATGLAIAAEVMERQEGKAALLRARDDLEARVAERTANLARTNQELVEEISERKQVEERLKYLSMHDPLTGLYNRIMFEEEIARLERGRQYPVSVIMADVDELKTTNDLFGHAAGDELLRRTAQVLRSSFRGEDIIARIGGDEFAILLPGMDEPSATLTIAHLKENLAIHNRTGNASPISFSLGVSTALAGRSLQDTLKEADDRMYLDKPPRRASNNRG